MAQVLIAIFVPLGVSVIIEIVLYFLLVALHNHIRHKLRVASMCTR